MPPARLARPAAVFALAVTLGASSASAGVIRGRVEVQGGVRVDAAPPNPYPGRASSIPGAHAVTKGAPTDAVIWVERLGAGIDSTLAGRPTPRLAQHDQMFVPRVQVVVVGGSIDFPNEDPIYHNVFSVSPVRRFDLGKYPRGQSRRVTFPKPGIINVYCDIHADMAAFIVVVPNRAFTRPDADGRYALPALPAGRYTVHAWHPDRPEARTELEVPATGDVPWDVTL
jgi:hypothetical protein